MTIEAQFFILSHDVNDILRELMKLHSLRASQEEELRYTLLAKMGFADRKTGLLNPLEPWPPLDHHS